MSTQWVGASRHRCRPPGWWARRSLRRRGAPVLPGAIWTCWCRRQFAWLPDWWDEYDWRPLSAAQIADLRAVARRPQDRP